MARHCAQESSVEKFGAVHAKVKEGHNEEETTRGASLRELKSFFKEHDQEVYEKNYEALQDTDAVCEEPDRKFGGQESEAFQDMDAVCEELGQSLHARLEQVAGGFAKLAARLRDIRVAHDELGTRQLPSGLFVFGA